MIRPACAVASIRHWWHQMGRRAYPQVTDLFITADAGASNGYCCRAWKLELQQFADATGLHIHVSHFPRGRAGGTRSSIGSSATLPKTGAVRR